MRKLFFLGIIALVLTAFTGCMGMGKVAQPIDRYKPTDPTINCDQLKVEMLDSRNLTEERHHTWKNEQGWNGGAIVGGALFFPPMLFFTDFSTKAEVEYKGAEARYKECNRLYAEKDCGFEKPKVNLKRKGKEAAEIIKAARTRSDGEIMAYNVNEPWTGEWQIKASYGTESGTWYLRQTDNEVISKDGEITATADGPTLTGWYPGFQNTRNKFEVNMTSLTTLEGTVVQGTGMKTIYLKGKRLTPVPEKIPETADEKSKAVWDDINDDQGHK